MFFFRKQPLGFNRPAGIQNLTDFSRIAIAPTYRTNAITKTRLDPWLSRIFQDDLKFINFCWIVDRLRNTENLQTIFLTGGEPTLWEPLDQAIYYARKHKIKTVLRTNAIAPPHKSLPNRVVVSVHAYLDHPELRAQIEVTLAAYLKQRIPVNLRYFRRKIDNEETIAIGKNLAEKLNLQLDINQGYSDPELNCNNCTFYQLAVQPDGDTVTLCQSLPITAKLSEYLSLSSLFEKEFLPQLKTTNLLSNPPCSLSIK